jgi:hypothetical protein
MPTVIIYPPLLSKIKWQWAERIGLKTIFKDIGLKQSTLCAVLHALNLPNMPLFCNHALAISVLQLNPSLKKGARGHRTHPIHARW